MGQQSILHAVKSRRIFNSVDTSEILIEEDIPGSKPLCETLLDLQLSPLEKQETVTEEGTSTMTVVVFKIIYNIF